MPEIELVLDPELKQSCRDALWRHLTARWPEISLRPLRLPLPRRDARDGPLLAVLTPGATPPPGDPGELAVVRCDATQATPAESLLLQIDLEVGRIGAERSGQGPQRDVSPPPREVTRRALLQIPLPIGHPLPAVPWSEAELCLHQKSCDHCKTACPVGAIAFESGSAAIRQDICTGCGACIAECPTGALTSPYLSDSQWLVALDVWAQAGGTLAVHCPRAPELDVDDAPALPVACIGEVGVHHLATALAKVGRLPDLLCPDGSCPLRPQAEEALRRHDLMRNLQRDPGTEDAVVAGASRGERLVRALRRLRLISDVLEDASVGLTLRVKDGDTHCTLCSGCVNTCPTRALVIEDGPDAGILRLDAALCAGCGACAEICPEDVLEVHHTGLTDLLAPIDLVHEAKAGCKGCGAAYETPSFVAALRERMHAAGFSGVLMDRLEYCPECRARLNG